MQELHDRDQCGGGENFKEPRTYVGIPTERTNMKDKNWSGEAKRPVRIIKCEMHFFEAFRKGRGAA